MNANALSQKNADYDRIEKAITFIEKEFPTQPGLREIADHIGLSEYYFQRLFSRWVGITENA
jgi:AraC family transcriptional regulator of adaptative response/methylated-DNA-[protein]-cysteine methyltransferase